MDVRFIKAALIKLSAGIKWASFQNESNSSRLCKLLDTHMIHSGCSLAISLCGMKWTFTLEIMNMIMLNWHHN